MKRTEILKVGRARSGRAAWVAKTGILTAVAIVLMYLEFSIPLVPVFLKFDFSELAVLLASFSMGPLTGVVVEFLKNLAHLPVTHTGGSGELANFVVGAIFSGTAGLIYKYRRTKQGAILGMTVGTLTMTAASCLTNYFVMIPIYLRVFNIDLNVIVDMARNAGNPMVHDLRSLIAFVFVPFKLFKGFLIAVVTFLIYKKVSPLLHR